MSHCFIQPGLYSTIEVTLEVLPGEAYFDVEQSYLSPSAPFYQSIWGGNFEGQAVDGLLADSPYNETVWNRPDWEESFRAAQGIIDGDERAAALQELQVPLYEEGGYVIWGFSAIIDAASPRVKGIVPSGVFNLAHYGDFLLGTDFLGRDVLSRVLAGGRSVVVLAGLATVVGYALGATIGLIAGYSQTFVDPVLMRAMDVLLAFPPILFLLLLAAGAGASPVIVVVGIAIIQAPGVARVIRSATLEVSVKAYVEAAVARGEPTRRILRREIVPNIFSTIVADGGPRLTISILLVAGLNFLGLGLRPPAADWAVMISENRSGLSLNIWAVVAPAVLIGVLTVATNVVADAVARTRGVSVDETMMHR